MIFFSMLTHVLYSLIDVPGTYYLYCPQLAQARVHDEAEHDGPLAAAH
jgi:hypothetical protein